MVNHWSCLISVVLQFWTIRNSTVTINDQWLLLKPELLWLLIVNALQLNELSALRNTFYPEYKYLYTWICIKWHWHEWMSVVNESFTRFRLDLFCVTFGGGLFCWQVGHIPDTFLFFSPPISVFISVFNLQNCSGLASNLVSVWSLGQRVCCFSAAIAHLSSFWCFGNLQNHPVSLKMYASLLNATSKSVLNIKSWRHPT